MFHNLKTSMINTLENELEATHTVPKKTDTSSLEEKYLLDKHFKGFN